jgi:hypothetical protein
MASLVWRIPLWHIFPLRAGAHDPQYSIEDFPIVAPRSATTIRPLRGFWNDRFDDFPLFIGKIHRLASLSDLSQILPFLR